MDAQSQAAIRFRPERLLWAHGQSGFLVEPVHRSRVAPAPVALYLVEDGVSKPVEFDPAAFSYPSNKRPEIDRRAGFAGFRLWLQDEKGVRSNVASFLTPDLYQAIGRNQTFGQAARPLSVRTADRKAEDPVFLRAMWIEKPVPAQKALVVHALFDSRTAAGALRFTVRPGVATIIDTECTLIARTDIAAFGLAAMAAAHYSGSLNTLARDDIRPAIHEVDGLQIHTGSGEWIWRPVRNPAQLQISAFVDNDPRGFGLLQRDRRFESYLDDDLKWQRRPSLWIEPIGKWGKGEIFLQEIPSNSPNNKNIAAFWRPETSVKAGSEQRYVFRQFWTWTPPDHPEQAIVTTTRHGKTKPDAAVRFRRFLVQFQGEDLFPDGRARDIQARVGAGAAKVITVRVFSSPQTKTVRVVFDVDAGKQPLVELRVHLEAAQKTVSETWLYRWTL